MHLYGVPGWPYACPLRRNSVTLRWEILAEFPPLRYSPGLRQSRKQGSFQHGLPQRLTRAALPRQRSQVQILSGAPNPSFNRLFAPRAMKFKGNGFLISDHPSIMTGRNGIGITGTISAL